MFSTADSNQPAPFGLNAIDFGNIEKDGKQDDSPEFPLTPIELDLATLSMIATFPDPAIGTPTAMRLKSSSTLTFVTPEQSAWQRSINLPGTIHLESPFIPPSVSALTDIASLQNPFSSAYSRTASDDAVLDEIVDYFLSFGLSDLEPFPWSPETP